MAVRSSNPSTSSGLSKRRPICPQFSDAFVECVVLPSFLLEVCRELPEPVPPLLTTMVDSPRRLLTYSAVFRSFVPK